MSAIQEAVKPGRRGNPKAIARKGMPGNPIKLASRNCKKCGSSFIPTTGRQVYCGSPRTKDSCSAVMYEHLQKIERKPRLKIYRADYYLKNKEKIATNGRSRYTANRESILNKNKITQRPYLLKKKYGITVEQFDQMLAEQNGKCKICGGESAKRLHVDHCHVSGKVRGLLCVNCNVKLGWYERVAASIDKYLGVVR